MIRLVKDDIKYLPTLDELGTGDFFIIPCSPDKIFIKMGDVNDKGGIFCECLSNRGLGQTRDFNPYFSLAPITRVRPIEINEIKYNEYSLEEEE